MARALVLVILAWIGLFLTLVALKAFVPPLGAQTVVSPFKPWDGVWEGEFAVYQFDGRPVKRLKVRQQFRHVPSKDRFEQEGFFELSDPETGKKEIERALNTADWELKNLRCRVIKKGGREIVEHTGRIQDGYLFWSRSIPGAIESFREWIDGDTYMIEGTGLYGDPSSGQPMIMVGRYHRVNESPDTP